MIGSWLQAELELKSLVYSHSKYECSLIVLCGLPGAGKSTLAQCIVELASKQAAFLNRYSRCSHVEFDAVGGKDFADNRDRSRDLVADELRKGGIVIADDNQFYKSMRKEYARLAASLQAAYVLVHLDVPIKDALQRNDARQGKQKIPNDVIVRMAEKFDEPQNCLKLSGLESPDILAWQVILACNKLVPNEDGGMVKQHVINQEAAHKDFQRKEKIRQAVREARTKGLTGEHLNRIALGYNENV